MIINTVRIWIQTLWIPSFYSTDLQFKKCLLKQPFKYWTNTKKQDGVHLSGIQMVTLSIKQIDLEIVLSNMEQVWFSDPNGKFKFNVTYLSDSLRRQHRLLIPISSRSTSRPNLGRGRSWGRRGQGGKEVIVSTRVWSRWSRGCSSFFDYIFGATNKIECKLLQVAQTKKMV